MFLQYLPLFGGFGRNFAVAFCSAEWYCNQVYDNTPPNARERTPLPYEDPAAL